MNKPMGITITLAALVISSSGCTSITWRPLEEVSERQHVRDSALAIASIQATTGELVFNGQVTYERHSRLNGRDSTGQCSSVPWSCVLSVERQTASADGRQSRSTYTAAMFDYKFNLDSLSTEELHGVRLNSSKDADIEFPRGAGWLHPCDSAILALTESGDTTVYSLRDVVAVKVMRENNARTWLLSGCVVAVAGLILLSSEGLFSGSDPDRHF